MGAASTAPPPARHGRHAIEAVILVALPLAPSLLLGPLGLGGASGTFIMGAVAGMLAGVMVGWRFAILVAAVVDVSNFVAYPAAPYPVLAGLVMALTALLFGLTARRGLTSVIVMAPISVAFTLADPPRVLQGNEGVLVNAAVLGLLGLVGGLWGAAAGGYLGRRIPDPPRSAETLRRAVAFGLTLALVLGVATGVVVAMDLKHGGAWLLMTLLLLIQPGTHRTWLKTLQRVLGTVIGFAIALIVAVLVHSEGLVLLIALLFMAGAMYLMIDGKRPYWHFVTLLTPAIVLAEGASTNVVSTDIARLWFTLLGAAIALGLVAFFHLASRFTGWGTKGST